MLPEPQTLAFTAAAGVLVGAAATWLVYSRRLAALEREQALATAEQSNLLARLDALQQQYAQAGGQLDALREQLNQARSDVQVQQVRAEEREQSLKQQIAQFEANRQVLRTEFENLSREFLAARDKELRENNRDSVSALLKPLGEKIDGFQHRVNQVHGDMERNTAALSEQIRSLKDVGLAMSSEATNLTRALKGDKKLVGNWGEAQLERTLELAGLRSGEHYDSQASFRDESGQRHLPDFVVYLPGNKHLVIDSKVSLVDYEAAVSADTDGEREQYLARHGQAVKAHIDRLSDKEYAQLPGLGSPDFVLMFMPVEPAYIEVMKHHRELFSYGYQRGVVMVSHTTLMPILRTVSNLWMLERSSAEAREISDSAGDIFNAVCLVAERLQGLGSTLQTVNRKYNDTVTAIAGRQGLHRKVERFQAISQKASRQFPDQLEPLATDNDVHQLGTLVEPDEP